MLHWLNNMELKTSIASIMIASAVSCGQPADRPAAETRLPDSAAALRSKHTPDDNADKVDTTQAHLNGTYDAGVVKTATEFLQAHFKDDITKGILPAESRKFILSQFDLNSDGKKEIFLGLTGPYFCGSGGCNILLLQNYGKLITQFTVTQYPVLISASKTQEWSDLILFSRSKFRLVKFDGTRYPSNPSIQPLFTGKPSEDLPKLLDWQDDRYPKFTF
jgi:hypothetical protein